MRETPVMVRTSERTMFLKCRQAWWWSYVEQRKPLDTWSPALIFGDMIHRALAEYYIPETRKERRRGPHPAQTFKKIYNAVDAAPRQFSVKVDDEKWVEAEDLGIEMMENYVDEWRDEDKDILILYPEMPFQYNFADNETGEHLCIYVGTTDSLIMRLSTKEIGLFEHKTAGTIDTGHLFIDEQAGTYWDLIPRWLQEEEIFDPKKMPEFKFMLYNYMRKAQKDTRTQNAAGQYLNLPTKEDLVAGLQAKKILHKDGKPVEKMTKDNLLILCADVGLNPDLLGQPSKSQPPPLFHREVVFRGEHEREMTHQRITEHVRDMNACRAGEIPHYKAPSKDCKFCEWRDLCELHEQGDDWKELRKYTTAKWSPYAAHVWALDLG